MQGIFPPPFLAPFGTEGVLEPIQHRKSLYPRSAFRRARRTRAKPIMPQARNFLVRRITHRHQNAAQVASYKVVRERIALTHCAVCSLVDVVHKLRTVRSAG